MIVTLELEIELTDGDADSLDDVAKALAENLVEDAYLFEGEEGDYEVKAAKVLAVSI